MKILLFYSVAGLLVALSMLGLWRQLDRRADARAWRELSSLPQVVLGTYDPALVRELPEAARRYFAFTIAPGTPLHTAVELRMVGELGLGTKASHRYHPMREKQLLTPPHGRAWQVEAGPFSGSDAALPKRSWTRFWLYGLLPVARVEGADHLRSAIGRVVGGYLFGTDDYFPFFKASITEVQFSGVTEAS